jgi:hypothetical protein
MNDPRGGEKIELAPHQAMRYRERSTFERVDAHIKDDFGALRIHVRGHAKVLAHLMFGVLCGIDSRAVDALADIDSAQAIDHPTEPLRTDWGAADVSEPGQKSLAKSSSAWFCQEIGAPKHKTQPYRALATTRGRVLAA